MELCQLKEAQEEKSFVADMSPDQAQKQFLSFHLYLSEAERVIGFQKEKINELKEYIESKDAEIDKLKISHDELNKKWK